VPPSSDERERGRLEVDALLGLHDDVVQTLFGVGMEIEAVAIRLGEDDMAVRLHEAAAKLDWLIDRLRRHDERSLTPFS
jgi:hypothetical protein